MSHSKFRALIRFLLRDLALPVSEVRLALRLSEQSAPNAPLKETLTNLPMVLWQYGLVTLAQLDQIFDWLEQSI